MWTKECVSCRELKDVDDFYRDTRNGDGVDNQCKECSKMSNKRWKENNPAKAAKAIKRWRAKNKDKTKEYNRTYAARTKGVKMIWLHKYLSEHPCVDCGETNTLVLVFDHVRGKKVDGVVQLAVSGRSMKKIEAEIKKCDVRCRNCHHTRHSKDSNTMPYQIAFCGVKDHTEFTPGRLFSK